MNILLKNNVSR